MDGGEGQRGEGLQRLLTCSCRESESDGEAEQRGASAEQRAREGKVGEGGAVSREGGERHVRAHGAQVEGREEQRCAQIQPMAACSDQVSWVTKEHGRAR